MRFLLPICVALASTLEAQTYIDSARCRDCHREIAERYAKTGMANTFAPVSSTAEFDGLLAQPFRHSASGDIFSAVIANGTARLRRHQTGLKNATTSVAEKAIEFRFGSGEHSRSYFGRDALGNLVELPVSWYSEAGGRWAMSPGFDAAQHAGFSRRVNPQCIFCHNAYPRPGATQIKAEGIDCQRCHGPGSAHVENPARGTIVNPARLAPARRIEVCLQCHLETTNLALPGEIVRHDRDVFSYKPGEPLGEYALFFDHKPGAGYDEKFEFSSAPYRLFQSACYRANPDALTCTTCHDPHGGDRAALSYARVCNSCHSGKLPPQHPAGADCVSCHMAKRRPSDAVHVTVMDHKISRRPAKDPPGAPAELNGLNMPPYRGEVVLYYPREASAVRDADLYLAMAQVRNQANLAGGIPALQAAIARLRPSQPEPYLDLADALRRTGQAEKATEQYREAARVAPANWRTHYGLALALAGAGNPRDALVSIARALELAPGEAALYETAASIRTTAGQHPEAVATLRAGIRVVPDSADLHNNLGTALLRTGATKDAEGAFREAVRLRPEISGIRLNLANLLARTARPAEAKFEFEAAIRLDPASAEAHSSFGTALASQGKFAESRTHFEAALRLNPKLANTHNNLGTVLQQIGDHEGAVREFRKALELDPALETARRNLDAEVALKPAISGPPPN